MVHKGDSTHQAQCVGVLKKYVSLDPIAKLAKIGMVFDGEALDNLAQRMKR